MCPTAPSLSLNVRTFAPLIHISRSKMVCSSKTQAIQKLTVLTGNMCYCGNSFSRIPTLASDQSGTSDVVCAGDKTAYCGSANGYQVYAAASASGSLLVTSTMGPMNSGTSSVLASTGPASVSISLGLGSASGSPTVGVSSVTGSGATGMPVVSNSSGILSATLSASGSVTIAGSSTPSASPTGTQIPGTFRLFVKNDVKGLDALGVGEGPNNQIVVGENVDATVLEITNSTNMTDLTGNSIYFIPNIHPQARLSDASDNVTDTDPTLMYGSNPPSDAVTSGYSLDGGTLGSNSTSGNYTFYTCQVTPDEQPIYVAPVGQVPSSCYRFDLVTTPPPLNDTNTTSSAAASGLAATSGGATLSSSPAASSSAGGATLSGSPAAPSSAGVSLPAAGSSVGTTASSVTASLSSASPTIVTSVAGYNIRALYNDPGGVPGNGGSSGGGSLAPSATGGSSNGGGSSVAPLLAATSIVSTAMTVDFCASKCDGYQYFGIENGQSEYMDLQYGHS